MGRGVTHPIIFRTKSPSLEDHCILQWIHLIKSNLHDAHTSKGADKIEIGRRGGGAYTYPYNTHGITPYTTCMSHYITHIHTHSHTHTQHGKFKQMISNTTQHGENCRNISLLTVTKWQCRLVLFCSRWSQG